MLFPVLIGVSDFFCKRNVPMRIIGKKTVIIEIFYHILKNVLFLDASSLGLGLGCTQIMVSIWRKVPEHDGQD